MLKASEGKDFGPLVRTPLEFDIYWFRWWVGSWTNPLHPHKPPPPPTPLGTICFEYCQSLDASKLEVYGENIARSLVVSVFLWPRYRSKDWGELPVTKWKRRRQGKKSKLVPTSRQIGPMTSQWNHEKGQIAMVLERFHISTPWIFTYCSWSFFFQYGTWPVLTFLLVAARLISVHGFYSI